MALGTAILLGDLNDRVTCYAIESCLPRERISVVKKVEFFNLNEVSTLKPNLICCWGIKNEIQALTLQRIKQIDRNIKIISITEGNEFAPLIARFSNLSVDRSVFEKDKIIDFCNKSFIIETISFTKEPITTNFSNQERLFLGSIGSGETWEETCEKLNITKPRYYRILDRIRQKTEIQDKEKIIIYAIKTGLAKI